MLLSRPGPKHDLDRRPVLDNLFERLLVDEIPVFIVNIECIPRGVSFDSWEMSS